MSSGSTMVDPHLARFSHRLADANEWLTHIHGRVNSFQESANFLKRVCADRTITESNSGHLRVFPVDPSAETTLADHLAE